MVLAVVFGVWMARSALVDRSLRPVLDAGQVMPPFVYLVPVLALFGATRFTAIVAGDRLRRAVAIKIVADGIRRCLADHRRGGRRRGSNRWQVITKVQLPMARGALCWPPTRACSTCCRWS